MGQPPLNLVLAPKNDGVAAALLAEQVFGEVQAGLGEPFRTGHAGGIIHHHFAGAIADDVGEIPDGPPEIIRRTNRPAP